MKVERYDLWEVEFGKSSKALVAYAPGGTPAIAQRIFEMFEGDFCDAAEGKGYERPAKAEIRGVRKTGEQVYILTAAESTTAGSEIPDATKIVLPNGPNVKRSGRAFAPGLKME